MSTISSDGGSLPIKNLKAGPADPKLSEITLVSSSSEVSDDATGHNVTMLPPNAATSLPTLISTPKRMKSPVGSEDNGNNTGRNFFNNVFNGFTGKINGNNITNTINTSNINREPSPGTNVAGLASEQENDSFHRLFKLLPKTDKLLSYTDCDLITDGAVSCSGKLFVSQLHLSYNANYSNWFAQLQIPLADIKSVELINEASDETPERLSVSTRDAVTIFALHSVNDSPDHTFQLINEMVQNRGSRVANGTTVFDIKSPLEQNTSRSHSVRSGSVVDNPVGLLPQTSIPAINVRELTEKFIVSNVVNAIPASTGALESAAPVIPGSIAARPLPSGTTTPKTDVSRAAYLITQILDANSKINTGSRDIEKAIRSIDDTSPSLSHRTSSISVSSNSSVSTTDSASSKSLGITTASPMSARIPIFKFKPDSKYKFNGPFYRPVSAPDLTTDFEHEKKEYQLLERTVNCPPGVLFEILFSNTVTDFTQDFIKAQDGTDITPIAGFIDNTRSYSYIKHLHLPVGPKQTNCNLTETIMHWDELDYIEVLESTMTPDVPSGRSFYTKSRYLIRWDPEDVSKGVKPQRCILRLSYWIEWVSRSWIEKMIESNCRSVMIETVKLFEDLLDKYIEENVEAGFIDDTEGILGGEKGEKEGEEGVKEPDLKIKETEPGSTERDSRAFSKGSKESLISEEVGRFNKLLNERPVVTTVQLRGSFAIVLLLALLLINTVLLAGVLYHLIKLNDTFTKYFQRNAVKVLLEESRRIIPMDRILTETDES